MVAVNGWAIAGLVIALYVVIVLALYRAGLIGPDRTLSLFGPALMIKTRRGRAFLDRVARARRFWTAAGDVGIVLAAAAMITIVALLVVDAFLAFRLTAAEAPSPVEALGIPGINPIIPLGYGLLALVIGVVLHELLHGVLARSQSIGVRSIGVLWLVVPVGAFVEQDDREMAEAPRRRRDRVAAAGVLANFVLALVFFVAASAVVASSVVPNATGVGVSYVVSNTPAAAAGIHGGDIITAINGTATPTTASLIRLLSRSTAGETVTVSYYSSGLGRSLTQSVTLASNPSNASEGFLGVGAAFLTPSELKSTLVNPLGSSSGPLVGATDWLVLPIATLMPVSGTTISFYHLAGPFGGTDPGTFWVGVNILYWLAWMNLLLGVSNALPLVPLDGGLLFRDFAASLASRLRRGWDPQRLDRFAGQAATVASVVVLILLLWQFVVPRL